MIFILFILNIYAKTEGHIGEIRASLLSESQFQSLYGDEWVLLDGKTELKTGEGLKNFLPDLDVLPDARGRYLRMLDHSKGLIKEDVGPGDVLEMLTSLPRNNFISDRSGLHSHGMSEAGSHSHNIHHAGEHSHAYTNPQGNAHIGHFSSSGWEGTPGARTSSEGNHTHNIDPSPNHVHTINSSGDHNHKINDGGDYETRPQTLMVNYFIKIRESKLCQFDENNATTLKEYFSCTKTNISKWQKGEIKLSELKIAKIIRDLVFTVKLKREVFTQEEISYVNNLSNKYIHYLILE